MYLSTFIHQYTGFVYVVKKWPKCEISRCTEESYNGIQVFYGWVIAQYAFKFAHERIAVLVGEYMRMHDLVYYPL